LLNTGVDVVEPRRRSPVADVLADTGARDGVERDVLSPLANSRRAEARIDRRKAAAAAGSQLPALRSKDQLSEDDLASALPTDPIKQTEAGEADVIDQQRDLGPEEKEPRAG
jgi:hypothetical protein